METKKFLGNINRELQSLAVDIIPDNEQLKNAKVCITNIVKLLQRKSNYKIGQVCIAGSAGKKTTIRNSDLDCVLFINGELPPFKNVLEDFKNILSSTDTFQLSNISITECSIQFKANNFDFDVLPAANFVSHIQNVDSNVLNDLQQRATLDYIKQDPAKFGYVFSGSLAKSTVNFMKQQDGFVNEIIRLAKFWFQTLHFEEKISGAKSLIELIAVHSAINEPNNDYWGCFAQVVKHLQHFDQLNIVFEKEYKFPEHQILDESRPRVIDPVNPYNNLAKNWTVKSIELMKQYANETYRRIQYLADENIIRLDFLFEPQPTRLPIYQTPNYIIKKPVKCCRNDNDCDVTFLVPMSNEKSIHISYRI